MGNDLKKAYISKRIKIHKYELSELLVPQKGKKWPKFLRDILSERHFSIYGQKKPYQPDELKFTCAQSSELSSKQ